MRIADEIMRIIGEGKKSTHPVMERSNLYTDLGYDSLAFVRLLLEIEDAFSIEFGLMEMNACLHVDRLISLAQQKVKEREHDQALAGESTATG